ncbi:MAG: heavy metal translocating P-type ATPase, partial [Chloroflexi bacterium]
AQKAPSQRWVDRFARYYTPAVVALAVLIAIVPPLFFGQPFLEPLTGGHGWLYRALALLIIACPCALVISTPVSIVSAISSAARNGVLVKGGVYLEATGGLRVVAFDKTGTLTRGQPALTDLVPNPEAQTLSSDGREREDDLLRLAASAERVSEHPLAAAIVAGARARRLDLLECRDFQAVPGHGLVATVNGRQVLLGNRRLMEREEVEVAPLFAQAQALEDAGKTVIFVAAREPDDAAVWHPLGLLAVADTVRPDAREAVTALKRSGIRRTVMLTGDNARTAAAIAAQVGVDEVRSNLLPAEKVDAVETLLAEHGSVAMVGDGVNDAPALARATVGIAMGGAGTDQALETADIVLMADDLSKLPFAVQLSRRTLGVIRQNIGFSLLVKAVFMALALPGLATLWMAVFADMGASLIVILNGMRLLRSRPQR